jgi:hypothetical protein
MNSALARGLGVMLKLDFQRAVLQRIPKIAANPKGAWRDILFVADEYHAFAAVGETDPTGGERAFALSRQAGLIPIVATQSISSLRSALGSDEASRTLGNSRCLSRYGPAAACLSRTRHRAAGKRPSGADDARRPPHRTSAPPEGTH